MPSRAPSSHPDQPAPSRGLDPALKRMIEAIARADARRDFAAALAAQRAGVTAGPVADLSKPGF